MNNILAYTDVEASIGTIAVNSANNLASLVTDNYATIKYYNTYSDGIIDYPNTPEFIKIVFQERIKDLYIFCIYKNDLTQYNIALFEIDGGKLTDSLSEIIKILKKDLSVEEFREYERQIFKYF